MTEDFNDNRNTANIPEKLMVSIKEHRWSEELFNAITQGIINTEDIKDKTDHDWLVSTYIAEAERTNNLENEAFKLKTLDEVTEEDVSWLIPGYLPRGHVTIMAGDGGSGKTSIWCNLVASITSGHKSILGQAIGIPFDDTPQDCMFFSSEDPVSSVLKKRLKAYGADERRISFMDLKDPCFKNIRFDSPALSAIIKVKRPALCVFDPLQSFLDASVQMGSRNAMRAAINPLIGLGEETGTSFLIICHTNKRIGQSGRNRISDSSDLWDICRSALICGHVPGGNGEHYLSHEKSNFGPLQDTVLFTMNNGVATFQGTTTLKDADYMSQVERVRQSPKRDEAKELILEYLTEHQDEEVTVSDLDSFVLSCGVTKYSLKDAKARLKDDKTIKIMPKGFGQDKRHIVLLQ